MKNKEFLDGLLEHYMMSKDVLPYRDGVVSEVLGGGGYYYDDTPANYYVVVCDYDNAFYFSSLDKAEACASYSVQPHGGGYHTVMLFATFSVPTDITLDGMEYL